MTETIAIKIHKHKTGGMTDSILAALSTSANGTKSENLRAILLYPVLKILYQYCIDIWNARKFNKLQ